jgi:hypothetical protein
MCARLLAASLFRSQFRGEVWLVSSRDHQLFRTSRGGFVQIRVPNGEDESRDTWAQRGRVALELENTLAERPGCFVWILDAAGIALRNIEHLIASCNYDHLSAPEIDLFWTDGYRCSGGTGSLVASPGIWAVRGEHIPLLFHRWLKRANDCAGDVSEAEIWSAVAREIPLKKRLMEKGEVYSPEIGSVNWEAVSNAAFVTVPDWPEKEQWKFLQALYFGTYFGDETGLMLNILDP